MTTAQVNSARLSRLNLPRVEGHTSSSTTVAEPGSERPVSGETAAGDLYARARPNDRSVERPTNADELVPEQSGTAGIINARLYTGAPQKPPPALDTVGIIEWGFMKGNLDEDKLHPLNEELLNDPEIGSSLGPHTKKAFADTGITDVLDYVHLLKPFGHGKKMAQQFVRKDNPTKPILLEIADNTEDSFLTSQDRLEEESPSLQPAFEKALTRLIDRGVKIFSMSIGCRNPEFWPDFDAYIAKHPDVLFVVAAGNEGISLENDEMQASWPHGSATEDLPNLVFVGRVDKALESDREATDAAYRTRLNFSKRVAVSCTDRNTDTSPSTAEFSRLLGSVQRAFIERGKPFCSQDVLKATLNALDTVETYHKEIGDYEMKVFGTDTFEDLLSRVEFPDETAASS